MKNLFTFLLFIATLALSAQKADRFTENNSDSPRDPRADQMNFVPNEVLVKFKDDVIVPGGTNLKSAGISSVDRLLKANGVASLEKLFPAELKLKSARIVKDPQGQDMKIPSLHNIYKITVPQLKSTGSAPVSVFQFIEELKALEEVEYAEPNYIYSVDNLQPVGPILTAEDIAKLSNENLKSEQTTVTPNDPLYSQQWYIPAVKADQVWEQTTGDTTQVIAILDTGVDWNHPDLKNKIWRNKAEIPDNGRDDDGNGLIDDIRGWDYINNDNNPTDDNSHGTHVAGIAAAESNNGIGIAGVNWKAKIMPIKVFQSSGRGDAANIAKGIIYATQKGATVINMSFGSYARSLAMEDALANAYATAVLVAAAGNDNKFIGPGLDCSYQPGFPFFPAALSYVLGTGAGSVCGLGFSNYDDSPTFSDYPELFNYELNAPGINILSTIPNGNYRVYSGTSMAAPIVSGAMSLYKTKHPLDSQELMWGNLINAVGSSFIDISSAINIIPTPKLMFVSKTLVDTLAGDNKNNLVDAGEKIQLSFMVRNTWGQSDSVYVGLKLGEFEDTTTAQIIKNSAFIGSISPYASRSNERNPLLIQINPNIANSRDIVFEGLLWFKGSKDTVTQRIVLTASHGTYLSGVMDSTMILTPNYLWIVNNSFRVGSNGYLKILPGTKIIMGSGKFIDCRGRIDAIGKPDSLIVFTSDYGDGSGIRGSGHGIIRYCYFSNLTSPIIAGAYDVEYSQINSCYDRSTGEIFSGLTKLKNNIIQGNFYAFAFFVFAKNIEKNNFIKNYPYGYSYVQAIQGNIQYNNFVDQQRSHYSPGFPITLMEYNSFSSVVNNNFISSNNQKIIASYGTVDIINFPKQYWGTANLSTIKNKIYDFWSDASLPQINFNPYLTQPSDSTHGIVWKVLVDGIDPQDQANLMNPIGVGAHRFDVYFNRPMDSNYKPQITFGVRSPYTQQAIADSGRWNVNNRVWTAYKNIQLLTGDGINTIRIAGARDLENFEIPVENMRFGFVISAANSASMEFMATPSLGKVNLEWNNNDLADGLGFNMYRMEHVNDSVLTKPVLVNKTLITDTLYTDFAVTPNKKYYYYYKILRTNLSETDSSKVVSATPFTASKGDANGDFKVNVLDITTIVAYLLNNNPQPFITEAADLNSDGSINVLDIVGVVNLVLENKSAVITTSEQVHLYMQNDTLFADTPFAIGGIQFDISGAASVEEIQKLKALDGFESGYSSNDKGLRLIYYSLSGKTIPSGNRIPLLRLKKGSGVSTAIFADKSGTSIPVDYLTTGVWNLSDQLNESVAELGQNYPNPLNRQTTIPIRINEPVDEAVIRIVNMYGQTVETIRVSNPTVGEHLLQWNSVAQMGFFAYLLEIRRGKQQFICPVRKMIVQ